MESKSGINNEKKIELCNCWTFKLSFGSAAGTNFLESYLEEYFVGIYFREFNQNGGNRESTGASVWYSHLHTYWSIWKVYRRRDASGQL